MSPARRSVSACGRGWLSTTRGAPSARSRSWSSLRGGEVLPSGAFGPPHGKAARPPVKSPHMPSVWRSNVYLLVSFPIGLVTFVYFVTMLSLGVSLLIIWVGIPILIATVASTRFFATGERRRAAWLLG